MTKLPYFVIVFLLVRAECIALVFIKDELDDFGTCYTHALECSVVYRPDSFGSVYYKPAGNPRTFCFSAVYVST